MPEKNQISFFFSFFKLFNWHIYTYKHKEIIDIRYLSHLSVNITVDYKKKFLANTITTKWSLVVIAKSE